MNKVEIKINPYKQVHSFSVDGKAVSPYSELNNFLYEPFLTWADKVFDVIERELNDDYEVTLYAEAFEWMILQCIGEQCRSCTSMERGTFCINLPVEERRQLLKNICQNHFPEEAASVIAVGYYNDGTITIPEDLVCKFSSTDMEHAFVAVLSDMKAASGLVKIPGSRILVMPSSVNEGSEAVKRFGQTYVWFLDECHIPEAVDSIAEHFGAIEEVKRMGGLIEGSGIDFNDDEDKDILMAASIDPFVVVNDIPPIETGHSSKPQYRVIPESVEPPALTAKSLNNNIVEFTEGCLIAKGPGHTVVEFYREGEVIPFDKKNVTVYKNCYIQSIKINMPADTVGVGYKLSLGYDIFPSDAEDLDSLTWSTDRPDIAEINGTGELMTKAPGICRIFLRSTRGSGEATLTVKPQITGIQMNIHNCHGYVGNIFPVSCNYEPKDCFNHSIQWLTSDQMVAEVEELSDHTLVIHAKGIGQCRITAQAVEGGASDSCYVDVDSTLNKSNAPSPAAIIAIAVFVVIILVLIFSIF